MPKTATIPKFERMRKEVGYECKVKKIRHSVICNHFDQGWTYYIDGVKIREFRDRDDAMDFAKSHVRAVVLNLPEFFWAGWKIAV